MEMNELTHQIIGAAMRVHTALGPGLFESVHQKCLHYELLQSGLQVRAECPVPILYKDVTIDVGYRVDFLVEDQVLLELIVKVLYVLAFWILPAKSSANPL